MMYQVLSTSCCERFGGHDALDIIRLKWEKFRFQILVRQNLANYVHVTIHVLKCAYLYLLSLNTQNICFSILWICAILWIMQKKSLNSEKSLKYGVSGAIDELLRTLFWPRCSRTYSLEMRNISISNFMAPRSCKLCICNCLCA